MIRENFELLAMAGKKSYVDFASVPPSQWKIHDRLGNWARSVHGASGERQRIKTSPMFGLYRSTEAKRAYGSETSIPIDHSDAVRIQAGIIALPDKHRRALNWLYPDGGKNPTQAARVLAVTLERLAELVSDARQMLINRKV